MSEQITNKLAEAGVFKGFNGLEGLANAKEFWDEQPYGTRLYYGPGITDYLHRGVLEAAIRLLKEPDQTEALSTLSSNYTAICDERDTLRRELDRSRETIKLSAKANDILVTAQREAIAGLEAELAAVRDTNLALRMKMAEVIRELDTANRELAAARDWQPIESAPKDGKKFVALKVTIVDEYDDEFSRDTPVRENVEMFEPVIMQWVQFAKFMDGQFMEIPHKMYRNPIRYIGWSPLPPHTAEGRDEGL